MAVATTFAPMNSIKLAQRLGRHLNIPDAFNLNSDAALDVLAAANGGLACFYRNAPTQLKRTKLSHTVRAPRNVTLTFQDQYSRLVANDSFVLRDNGCTVRFANGSANNIVTGPNSLLDNYLRDDLTTDATIYSDAVPIQDVIEKVIGHLQLFSSDQSLPSVVVHDERLRAGSVIRTYHDDTSVDDAYVLDASLNTIGRPRYYYLEPMGVSQGAEPEFVLRLAPLPDKDYTIRMEAELATQRLTFVDLNTPREIFVPSNCIDDILVPLCEAELTSSPLWRDKDSIARFQKAGESAIGRMGALPTQMAEPSNTVGTPAGF